MPTDGMPLLVLSFVYVSISKNAFLLVASRGASSFSGCKGTNFPRTGKTFPRLFSGKTRTFSEGLTKVKGFREHTLSIIYARIGNTLRDRGTVPGSGTVRTARLHSPVGAAAQAVRPSRTDCAGPPNKLCGPSEQLVRGLRTKEIAKKR